MLLVMAAFSVVWFFVAPNLVQKYGDPELAGWIPFWMIPASLAEFVVWVIAMWRPNKLTQGLFYVVAAVQLLIGCGWFPK